LFLYKNVFVIFKYEKERQNNDYQTKKLAEKSIEIHQQNVHNVILNK